MPNLFSRSPATVPVVAVPRVTALSPAAVAPAGRAPAALAVPRPEGDVIPPSQAAIVTTQTDAAEQRQRQQSDAALRTSDAQAVARLQEAAAGADAQATPALAERQATEGRTTAELTRAATEQNTRQTARDDLHRQLETAKARTAGIDQAVLEARERRDQAQADLDRLPVAAAQPPGPLPTAAAPAGSPGAGAISMPSLSPRQLATQALRQRDTALQDRIQEQTQHGTLLTQLRTDLKSADTALDTANEALQKATAADTVARQAVIDLRDAQTAARAAMATNLPQLQAHLQAQQAAPFLTEVQTAVREAEARVARAKDVADAVQASAEAATALVEQDKLVAGLRKARKAEEDKLPPLAEALGQASRSAGELDTQLQNLQKVANTPAATLQEAGRQLRQARASERTAQRDVDDQNTAIQNARDALTDPERVLTERQQGVRDTTQRQTAADAALTAQETAARNAADAAQATRGLHAAARPAFEAAFDATHQSVDALCRELLPPDPAAPARDRSLLERAGDAFRRVGQGIQNRTAPVVFDANLGPLAGARYSSATTGFQKGFPPGGTVTTKDASRRAREAMNDKTNSAGKRATSLWSGRGNAVASRVAQTPAAFRAATAFTQEVTRMFEAAGPTPGLPSTTHPTLLAEHLLNHPAPAGRSDGHPLRHEEALLIATALRAVTADANEAVHVYNHLWNGLPPALGDVGTRAPTVASPLQNHPASQTRHSARIPELAHVAARALANSEGGMQALTNLQGLTLPPAGDRRRLHAERSIELYKLALRAEDVLLSHGINAGGEQSTAGVERAVLAQRPELRDPTRLGRGPVPGAGGRMEQEHPATLACQAFLHAKANMGRAANTAEQHVELKPALVALRQGFDRSGEGSDFHRMAKRLHKLVTYVDRMTDPPTSIGGKAGRSMRRFIGKDKTPFKALLYAGALGSDLETVQEEHEHRLHGALDTAQTLLRADLAAHGPALPPADATRAVLRLATMELWADQVKAGRDLSQGISLDGEAIQARAEALAAALPTPAALDAATVTQHLASHTAAPLLPGTLHAWFQHGHLANPAVPADRNALQPLNRSLQVLMGMQKIDDGMQEIQDRFETGTAADRREILRELLIRVVSGNDLADYSDGRRHAIELMGGNAVTPGVTLFASAVGVISAEYARTAVLKVGVASNTGMLFLGNEVKFTGSVGGGGRLGVEVGPVLNVSSTALGRIGGSHLASKGLMVRTNKLGTEHEALTPLQTQGMTSSGWQRMSELAVNTLMKLSDPDGPPRPANGGDMWARTVQALGDYRDISFGWNEGKATSVHGSVTADAGASLNAGKDFRFSAVGSLGLKQTFNRSQTKESGGDIRSAHASRGNKLTLTAGASVGVSHPTIAQDGQPSMGVFTRHKVGVETEFLLRSTSGLVRFTTQHGRINATQSYKQREFGLQDDFVRLVNAERSTWEQRLGQRSPDGTLRGGRAVLDDWLQQVVNLKGQNNRLFIERKCLTPEAAESLNACLDRIRMLEADTDTGRTADRGAQAEIDELHAQIAAHARDESNWQPYRLFTDESNVLANDINVSAEVRATPAKPEEGDTARDEFHETLTAGGRIVLSGRVQVARAGRDLLTLDAKPLKGPPPLVQAALEGRTDALTTLAQAPGARIDATDERGRTALMEAAAGGHLASVQALVGSAALDSQDHRGRTALMEAAFHGHGTVVQALLAAGADARLTDENGQTALLRALRGRRSSEAAQLAAVSPVDLQDNLGQTALMEAVARGDTDAQQALHAAGANVHLTDRDGHTALIHAAQNGRAAAVQTLLTQGAAVDHPGARNRTALMEAAVAGDAPTVQALRAGGATRTLRDGDGFTAAELATRYRRDAAATALA